MDEASLFGAFDSLKIKEFWIHTRLFTIVEKFDV